jgi:hypothetical protein
MKGKYMKISQSLMLIGVAAFCGAPQGHAQARATTLPLVPGSPAPNQGEQLPVELIEIGANGAMMPQALHRMAGRFVLVVSNANQGTVDAGVVIEPAAIGDLKLSASPLLKLGGKAVSDGSHRSAGLFAGAAGTFDLKDAVTGKILGKVVLH